MGKWVTAVFAAAVGISVQAQAQTLGIGSGAPVTTIDPHFHNVGPNNALTMHIFDRLIERDGRARPHPSLATAWRRRHRESPGREPGDAG